MRQRLDERREFQRLDLERPIVGRFGATNILIVNIGVTGALLEHHAEVGVGEQRRLMFQWANYEIQLTAEVVRSTVERFTGSGDKKTPVYRTGVKFLEAFGESDECLRQLIGFYVTRALELQKANARGLPFDEASFPDPAMRKMMGVRSEAQGYICCRLDDDGWKRVSTLRAAQPVDGFTVSASEPNIDMLCQSYEETGEEGRDLIRMLAELSVSGAQQKPPRRYEP
jgi:hypothetical protein